MPRRTSTNQLDFLRKLRRVAFPKQPPVVLAPSTTDDIWACIRIAGRDKDWLKRERREPVDDDD